MADETKQVHGGAADRGAVDRAWEESGRSALDELFEAVDPRDGSMPDYSAASHLASHAWAEVRRLRRAVPDLAESVWALEQVIQHLHAKQPCPNYGEATEDCDCLVCRTQTVLTEWEDDPRFEPATATQQQSPPAPASTGRWGGREMSNELRGVTVEDVRSVVAWLDSEQAPGAVVSHHGVGTTVGDFHMQIAPGPPSRRNGGSVLIFTVAEAKRETETIGHLKELTNGIDPAERDALQAIVAEVVPVLDAWNGLSCRCETCSFHIDKDPGPGVARARSNYVPFETGDSVTGIERANQEGEQ